MSDMSVRTWIYGPAIYNCMSGYVFLTSVSKSILFMFTVKCPPPLTHTHSLHRHKTHSTYTQEAHDHIQYQYLHHATFTSLFIVRIHSSPFPFLPPLEELHLVINTRPLSPCLLLSPVRAGSTSTGRPCTGMRLVIYGDNQQNPARQQGLDGRNLDLETTLFPKKLFAQKRHFITNPPSISKQPASSSG